MQVLAFAASNSRQSINKQVVTHAAEVFCSAVMPGATPTVLDLNDFDLPIFSIDLEHASGIPDAAHAFFEHIGSADALLVSYPVHNGYYPAVFKNLFDWASRIDKKVFQGKPMVIMSVTPGPSGGAGVLEIARESAPYFGAEIKASVSVPRFGDVFDVERGEFSDAALAATLRESLQTLASALAAD